MRHRNSNRQYDISNNLDLFARKKAFELGINYLCFLVALFSRPWRPLQRHQSEIKILKVASFFSDSGTIQGCVFCFHLMDMLMQEFLALLSFLNMLRIERRI